MASQQVKGHHGGKEEAKCLTEANCVLTIDEPFIKAYVPGALGKTPHPARIQIETDHVLASEVHAGSILKNPAGYYVGGVPYKSKPLGCYLRGWRKGATGISDLVCVLSSLDSSKMEPPALPHHCDLTYRSVATATRAAAAYLYNLPQAPAPLAPAPPTLASKPSLPTAGSRPKTTAFGFKAMTQQLTGAPAASMPPPAPAVPPPAPIRQPPPIRQAPPLPTREPPATKPAGTSGRPLAEPKSSPTKLRAGFPPGVKIPVPRKREGARLLTASNSIITMETSYIHAYCPWVLEGDVHEIDVQIEIDGLLQPRIINARIKRVGNSGFHVHGITNKEKQVNSYLRGWKRHPTVEDMLVLVLDHEDNTKLYTPDEVAAQQEARAKELTRRKRSADGQPADADAREPSARVKRRSTSHQPASGRSPESNDEPTKLIYLPQKDSDMRQQAPTAHAAKPSHHVTRVLPHLGAVSHDAQQPSMVRSRIDQPSIGAVKRQHHSTAADNAPPYNSNILGLLTQSAGHDDAAGALAAGNATTTGTRGGLRIGADKSNVSSGTKPRLDRPGARHSDAGHITETLDADRTAELVQPTAYKPQSNNPLLSIIDSVKPVVARFQPDNRPQHPISPPSQHPPSSSIFTATTGRPNPGTTHVSEIRTKLHTKQNDEAKASAEAFAAAALKFPLRAALRGVSAGSHKPGQSPKAEGSEPAGNSSKLVAHGLQTDLHSQHATTDSAGHKSRLHHSHGDAPHDNELIDLATQDSPPNPAKPSQRRMMPNSQADHEQGRSTSHGLASLAQGHGLSNPSIFAAGSVPYSSERDSMDSQDKADVHNQSPSKGSLWPGIFKKSRATCARQITLANHQLTMPTGYVELLYPDGLGPAGSVDVDLQYEIDGHVDPQVYYCKLQCNQGPQQTVHYINGLTIKDKPIGLYYRGWRRHPTNPQGLVLILSREESTKLVPEKDGTLRPAQAPVIYTTKSRAVFVAAKGRPCRLSPENTVITMDESTLHTLCPQSVGQSTYELQLIMEVDGQLQPDTHSVTLHRTLMGEFWVRGIAEEDKPFGRYIHGWNNIPGKPNMVILVANRAAPRHSTPSNSPIAKRTNRGPTDHATLPSAKRPHRLDPAAKGHTLPPGRLASTHTARPLAAIGGPTGLDTLAFVAAAERGPSLSPGSANPAAGNSNPIGSLNAAGDLPQKRPRGRPPKAATIARRMAAAAMGQLSATANEDLARRLAANSSVPTRVKSLASSAKRRALQSHGGHGTYTLGRGQVARRSLPGVSRARTVSAMRGGHAVAPRSVPQAARRTSLGRPRDKRPARFITKSNTIITMEHGFVRAFCPEALSQKEVPVRVCFEIDGELQPPAEGTLKCGAAGIFFINGIPTKDRPFGAYARGWRKLDDDSDPVTLVWVVSYTDNTRLPLPSFGQAPAQLPTAVGAGVASGGNAADIDATDENAEVKGIAEQGIDGQKLRRGAEAETEHPQDVTHKHRAAGNAFNTSSGAPLTRVHAVRPVPRNPANMGNPNTRPASQAIHRLSHLPPRQGMLARAAAARTGPGHDHAAVKTEANAPNRTGPTIGIVSSLAGKPAAGATQSVKAVGSNTVAKPPALSVPLGKHSVAHRTSPRLGSFTQPLPPRTAIQAANGSVRRSMPLSALTHTADGRSMGSGQQGLARNKRLSGGVSGDAGQHAVKRQRLSNDGSGMSDKASPSGRTGMHQSKRTDARFLSGSNSLLFMSNQYVASYFPRALKKVPHPFKLQVQIDGDAGDTYDAALNTSNKGMFYITGVPTSAKPMNCYIRGFRMLPSGVTVLVASRQKCLRLPLPGEDNPLLSDEPVADN